MDARPQVLPLTMFVWQTYSFHHPRGAVKSTTVTGWIDPDAGTISRGAASPKTVAVRRHGRRSARATQTGVNPMAGPEADSRLAQLEARMAAQHLRGQWQIDPNRPQDLRKGPNGQVWVDPIPAGLPHVWPWRDMLPIMREACIAMPESNTARRALIFTNPGLPRGTTQTMLATYQIVPPGEVAWAHRHTINALRFTIQGGDKVYTVVDGRALVMQPYDLILTPGWSWHDHHNEGSEDAIWFDGLDVPFTLALNQSFYEEPGAIAQQRTGGDVAFSPLLKSAGTDSGATARPYRYPWQQAHSLLRSQTDAPVDPHHGRVIDYVNPLTGGPVMSTLACQIVYLPPGFEGRPFRHSASSIAFVIDGSGHTICGERELAWNKHDSMVIPNWTWRRYFNDSRSEPAILFVMSDTPILQAFGFYRQENDQRAGATANIPNLKLSAAE
jgi:1-hydroxy-2-naphthoate dioxygenase